ncbi:ribonucleotide reductase of class Ia (aerobic), beta subunit [Stenotrophomonas phage RAS14]
MTQETVFNTTPVTTLNQYMFFGEQPNAARYDVLVHPIFDKLTDKMQGFFWKPQEIDVTKDQKDYKLLSDAQKHIFSKTISYQIVLDTIQSRSPNIALLPFVSIPELEACIETWCFFEQIHNRTYSYILQNVYPNPSELFDSIVLDDNIIKRSEETIKYYNDFLNASIDYRANGEKNISLRELKKKLILCVASINALEGLSFYASFACSFAFAEIGLMEGNAKLISLIARDENLHLAITQNIMKRWAEGKDDPVMAELYVEVLPEIRSLYENIVAQEKEWCEYLFKDGSLIGLNARILSEYVEYMAGKRMKNIGIKTDYGTKNPLPWTDKYLKTSDVQQAAQEGEITNYVIGGVKQDLSTADFSQFIMP